MKRLLSFTSCIVYFILLATTAQAQQPRFAKEMQEFKKADSINFPPVNAIVFTGSSSIRLWNMPMAS